MKTPGSQNGAPEMGAPDTPQTPSTKRMGSWLLIVLVAVVVIAAIAILIVLLAGGDSSGSIGIGAFAPTRGGSG